MEIGLHFGFGLDPPPIWKMSKKQFFFLKMASLSGLAQFGGRGRKISVLRTSSFSFRQNMLAR